VELLHLMPAAAAANRNAVLTVERFKLEVLAAEAAGRELKLDEVRDSRSVMCPVTSPSRRLMRAVQAIGGVVGF
jgi:hypothetical protein